MMVDAEKQLLEAGLVRNGDTYAVVVGTSRRPGIANIMKLRTVGDVEEPGGEG